MENFNSLLKKYAKLSVSTGVNIQKDQLLVITSPIECADFTRMIVEEAYLVGAKEVVVRWTDDLTSKLKFTYAPMEVFETFPEFEKDALVHYAKSGAAFLSISASDPELLKGLDTKKIAASRKSSALATKEFSDRLMSNKNSWSIISIPTKAWAKKVFSNLDTEKAVEKLWDEIFKIVRVNKEDPIASWKQHTDNLKEKMNYLNDKKLKTIHFKNSLGTDLYIDLVSDHIWLGGSEFTEGGVEFIANMPTEEIFTMPHKDGINGTVFSTKPLNYGGNLIDNFSLTFKDGKVIDFKAEKGYDTLKSLLETDDGAKSLGEVALVPFDSPISNSGIIFFNTLYDENASCHLAFGKAYSVCVKNGENMNAEELSKVGSNNSLLHVDFMIGSKDLNITGIDSNNNEYPIFKNGNWAF